MWSLWFALFRDHKSGDLLVLDISSAENRGDRLQLRSLTTRRLL
ncbi:MAG: hypothetical protein ACPGXX_07725 [Planctomycetaceae bacterium]